MLLLSAHNHTDSIVKALMDCDGTSVLASAMAKHVHDASMVESACKILLYISDNGTEPYMSATHDIHAAHACGPCMVWYHTTF